MEGNEMSVSFENQVFNRCSGLGGGRMGCTLVTGFLGSGKTTLLRHLLDNRGDLRLAVLVNEFAATDVDSLLLDSARLHSAFNLSTVSLTHGCACCDVPGPFRESLQRIVDSKHNFDCLLIETSGLARPDQFVAELDEVGVKLDLIVTVVDAESLDKIINLDIAKKQLERVDLVLLNKCDLASLNQISHAEDILEQLTGGAKVVRSQFCKVPLDLVIDCRKIEALNTVKEESHVMPVLSHEALPRMAFRKDIHSSCSVNIYSVKADEGYLGVDDKGTSKTLQYGYSKDATFSSVTFESDVPLSMAVFQSKILRSISSTSGLVRCKGIINFFEDRGGRFVFQWSGVKRVEAVSTQSWNGTPKSRLVFIGLDKSTLEDIVAQITQSVNHLRSPMDDHICRAYAMDFSKNITADGRFKDPSLKKESLVIFGLKSSPLRGIKESHLNGALMRVVNGKGNIFLTATTSGEDYDLQLLFDKGSDPDLAWNEIRLAANAVISKLCKNFCPCRTTVLNKICFC